MKKSTYSDKKISYENIKHRLVEKRKDIGYSQEVLSKKINISERTISRYETGKIIPSLEFLENVIAPALNTNLYELLKG